jgi:hypothetical protein
MARAPVKEGQRIELISMGEDPDPIQLGARGVVEYASEFQGAWQVSVKWDNGRTLSLVCPPDRFKVLAEAKAVASGYDGDGPDEEPHWDGEESDGQE